MPKAPSSLSNKKRHNPLEVDLVANGVLKNQEGKPSKRANKKRSEETENYVDARSSRKILGLSRELLQEEDHQSEEEGEERVSAFDFDPSRFESGHEQEEVYGEEEAWGDEEEEVEEIEVDENDLAIFNSYVKPSMQDDPLLTHGWDMKGDGGQEQQQGGGRNLADIILAKIAEKEAQQQGRWQDDNPVDEEYVLPPKVIEVFEKIGMFLSRYKSGPLPKPFKVLPQIPHWEDIIQVTRPDKWTPNACYAATRIFVASKPKVVQRFMEMVILDRVREDIYENKKLNVHLFNSLKKGLYKPAGFFKGFLRPLAASGTCTMREAQIVAGVLTRVSIPVIHSAMALKELCDIASEQVSQKSECVSATNYLIKVLLDKKYALPYQTIDSLVFHFARYSAAAKAADSHSELPVIYWQCLLVFAQRYRNDISEDQREMLLDILLTNGHWQIAPEIRRELLAGRGRGVPIEQPTAAFDGDDTMMM
ncbi:Bystin-domain-containing protein [Triangularia verruculosa]|uniref:Bystin-domain-containing protein n=1 Tax=Triangularia verruculosa TaxID=2587418 RepID=A0AAN6XAX3_9PEZI|nr:Bystin-domain-containing protein [Triangularia verruculosa]